MAGSFSFGSDFFDTSTFVPWTIFSTGDASGWINDPAQFSATAVGAIDTPNDRDIFALALVAGQTVTLDIDDGAGDGSNVFTALAVGDATGRHVARHEYSPPLDPGSLSLLDPRLVFTAPTTGLYFVAVTNVNDSYIGNFSFRGGAELTGDYTLNVSTPLLRPLALGSDNAGAPDNLSLSDLPDRIDLRAGDDTANLGGGNDIADGGDGNDTIRGGNGDDSLTGGTGRNDLSGGNGDDILVADRIGGLTPDTLSGDRGDDQLFGSRGADRLFGGDDNDLLFGGPGEDTLDGGAGIDTLSYGGVTAGVTINLTTNTAGGAAAGDAIVRFEDVIGSISDDTLRGNGAANVLDGTAGNDILVGEGGNDTLIGGLGSDSMDGGAGIDTISYELSDSVAVGLATNTFGNDAVGDFALNVENIVGSKGSDVLSGNGTANRLTGLDGDDVLFGGAGADILLGGPGDDAYLVDHPGDVVTELAGQGIDTIGSTITLTLGFQVENLVLNDSANLNGTGNELVNNLTGNFGNNVLDGRAGADIMAGLDGNDTYIVDNAGDTVVEEDNSGIDTVRQSVNHAGSLANNVENLTLTGAASINAEGNELANRIIGNGGANFINGWVGADIMSGGAGNDTYGVDDIHDLIIELPGGGIDTLHVFPNISITLPANVENLAIIYPFDNPVNATGNTLANVLIGNVGINILDGKAGADTMRGAGGNDIYIVDNVGDMVIELAGQGLDTIRSSLTRILPANVEDLNLLGTASINATGNSLANSLTGNSGNNVLDGGANDDSLAGGKGNDTYIVDDLNDRVIETNGQGLDTVRTAVSLPELAANVENLVLTGGSSIAGIGNALANALTGNSGHNLLDGQAGNDAMRGGFGNDIYVVDAAGDTVLEAFGQGTDTVRSLVTKILAANVENLLLLDGLNPDNPLKINGTGNTLVNTLAGNAGDNVLDGGAAADTMKGGAGNDTYKVDSAGDKTIEGGGQGIDSVQASVSFTLAVNLENLALTGTAVINGTGNTLANLLIGNAASNVLDGLGGADTMKGGAGHDTYKVNSAGDVVIEGSGQGTDWVQASVSFALAGNVEHLTLIGTANLAATGNALANTLTGNIGGNLLDGKAGNDTMKGGAGNDTYVVDAFDLVVEAAGQGIDTVKSSITKALASNVENLELTGILGINGSGNALANILTGNAASNILDGLAGADTMKGGAGHDTYRVDNAGDTVIEGGGQGTDLVQASVSCSLAANVENLTLAGTANIAATGNTLSNTIVGNAGNNLIAGKGGRDKLTGGGGADSFLFDTVPGLANYDTVADFNAAADRIVLDRSIFSALATGLLSADAFTKGSVAADAEDRIIFNTGNRNLYYDRDGTGGAAAVIFAHLDGNQSALSNTDFVVVA
jgi:Ca2+-binding RTX toxin-like protein